MGAMILVLLILIALPLLSLIIGSLHRGGTLSGHFFAQVFSSWYYLGPLVNSLVLGAWTALFSILIGVPLAWAVSRTDIPGKRFVRVTAVLSYVSPPFLLAIGFVNLLSPNAGVINVFFHDVIGARWLTFNVFTMQGLVLVTVLHTFPFVYMLTSSALASVDVSYEEASRILGAGRLRTALGVTLPLVAPAILSGSLIAFLTAISLFGSQAIVGLPGRIMTLPTLIFSLFSYPAQYGLASALSLIFIAITVGALYLQRILLAHRSYVTIGGKGSRTELIRLGAARWLLFCFAVLIFIVALVLPYGVLLAMSFSKSWGLHFLHGLTFTNYAYVLFSYDVTRRAISNSVFLAIATATAAVALGTLIAWLDLRTQVPGRRLFDYTALIPLGLPGIVMAVSLLQFWLAMPVALYGTFTILFLAYLARYMPLSVRAASSSLRQVDGALEESARILGASWGQTLREITIPLIRPGIFTGWILAFVPAFHELSASILLFSAGTITLSVAIFNLQNSGFTEPVAALAIINIVVIAIVLAIANQLNRRLARGQSTSVDAGSLGTPG